MDLVPLASEEVIKGRDQMNMDPRVFVTSFALFDVRTSVAYYESRTVHSRSFREESKP